MLEYQGDGNKAIFYYIADERVDFRQLIKVLAEAFRVRIEMKQIGARQEAWDVSEASVLADVSFAVRRGWPALFPYLQVPHVIRIFPWIRKSLPDNVPSWNVAWTMK